MEISFTMPNPLSVVVPAYNEESTLDEIVRRLLAVPELLEIIIVNDCSKDDTAAIAERLAAEHPQIRVAHHPVNRGKTEALKTGFALTRGEIVIVQDADLEYDPAEIPEVIAPIMAGNADVVYGSRFLVRKASRVLYFYHFLANKGLTFLSNLCTNVNMTDVETCYKAFRGDIIRNMVITSSGLGFEIEVTAKIAMLKASIYEVPISYYGRTYEQGKKIGMKDGFAALWYIFRFNFLCSLEDSFTAVPPLLSDSDVPLFSVESHAPVPVVQAPPPVRTTTGSVARSTALALVLLLLFDALVFRLSPYTNYVEPDSSTGLFELILRRELNAQKWYGSNLAVTFGDSRMAYYTRVSEAVSGRTGLILRNAGIAGSDARTWYYMLRELDPKRERYRAVILSVPDYGDEDLAFDPLIDLRAIHYAAVHLRFTDIPEIVGSYGTWATRWEAFRGTALRGMTFQADLLAFLANPSKRIDYVNLSNRGYPTWTRDYSETKRSMAGLQIDYSTLKAVMPPDADDNQKDTVKNVLLRTPVPQTGNLARFRRQWMGKIVDMYAGSHTPVIFVRLARGPIPRPDSLEQAQTSTVREFTQRPNVFMVDEHAFDSLERPELFKDGLHLNDDGCNRFSVMLSEEVSRVLASHGLPLGKARGEQ